MDQRIAHSAQAHRGLTYERRTPAKDCRWARGPRVEIGTVPWSPAFAYATGLVATDGWLSIRANGYSNMGFASKDRDLIEIFCKSLGIRAKIRERRRVNLGRERVSFEVSFSSVRLARWFQDVGITQRKSLTLGALSVPADYIAHTIRGLRDGDGSIARFIDGRGRHCFSVTFI